MVVDLAFVGAGNIAGQHLDNLEGYDDADVVAVCDIDEDAAAEWATVHDADVYTEWEAMFDDGGFDAVFVCVPPFAHEGQEQRAIEEGVDLFVEKPLGLERKQPREIRDAAAEAGIVTQVGHQNRYLEAVDHVEELIGDRTIATIYARRVGGVPGGDGHWWRSKATSGGQVVEQSTHTFDLVRYFGGDVDRVAAEGDLRVRTDDIDFPDAISATLRHEDGLPSHVMTSSASPRHDLGVTLVGEDFQLEIDTIGDAVTGVVDGEEIDFDGSGGERMRELQDFVDAVADGDPERVRSPYGDAYETFCTTLAVTEAVDSDEKVPVS
jgi:predicted dehydrogenase